MSQHLLIHGGEVVDGTGAPRRRADVRVHDGRIAEVGPGLERGDAQAIDATGALVTPGFIDTHAHTDPQVFWDPRLDPDPLHGVTTMLVGNCSLSLYPASETTRGQISDLFAYIEDVPRHLFDDEVPWTWRNYDGYRDAVNAVGTGINLAALVGHSPLRLAVMGDDAWTRVATPAERAQLAELFEEAMKAGAWGLSTSWLDSDSEGRPVPSRAADTAEFDALFDVIQSAGHGLVEVVPGLLGDKPEVALEDLARKLGSEGIGFYPQLSPRTVDFRLNWDSSMMFMSMPQGWHKIIAAQGADKADLLADPVWRAAAREEWDRTEKSLFPHRSLDKVRFVEVAGTGNEPWLGRTLADLVDERGGHPSDVFADFVAANDCHPGVVAVGVSNADVDGVARTLTDPHVLVSSSDAGAHMQMLCASGDTTLLLTRHVRERHDFTLEQAVHQLTGRLAAVFGLKDRGVIEPGRAGDFAVFNLDELHWDEDVFVADLPGGALRLRRPEGGFRATIVNGSVVQRDGKLTGALPGRVLNANEQ